MPARSHSPVPARALHTQTDRTDTKWRRETSPYCEWHRRPAVRSDVRRAAPPAPSMRGPPPDTADSPFPRLPSRESHSSRLTRLSSWPTYRDRWGPLEVCDTQNASMARLAGTVWREAATEYKACSHPVPWFILIALLIVPRFRL